MTKMTNYDHVARDYLDNRRELKTNKYLKKFIRMIGRGSLILDIGCGPGNPTDSELVKAGLLVTGIDISSEMIKIAQQKCSTCEYVERDLMSLKPFEYKVRGIVCLYTIFHIPREKQGECLKVFASYLQKGDPLLITFGEKEWEGTCTMYGQRIWFSQWGGEKNIKNLNQAGFETLENVLDYSGREKHQVVLARKK